MYTKDFLITAVIIACASFLQIPNDADYRQIIGTPAAAVLLYSFLHSWLTFCFSTSSDNNEDEDEDEIVSGEVDQKIDKEVNTAIKMKGKNE